MCTIEQTLPPSPEIRLELASQLSVAAAPCAEAGLHLDLWRDALPLPDANDAVRLLTAAAGACVTRRFETVFPPMSGLI